jgi:hypothetical protein
MLRLEAASISIRSIIVPWLIDSQVSQKVFLDVSCMQQLGDEGQFRALAITLAVVVFPTPLGPQNRYA